MGRIRARDRHTDERTEVGVRSRDERRDVPLRHSSRPRGSDRCDRRRASRRVRHRVRVRLGPPSGVRRDGGDVRGAARPRGRRARGRGRARPAQRAVSLAARGHVRLVRPRLHPPRAPGVPAGVRGVPLPQPGGVPQPGRGGVHGGRGQGDGRGDRGARTRTSRARRSSERRVASRDASRRGIARAIAVATRARPPPVGSPIMPHPVAFQGWRLVADCDAPAEKKSPTTPRPVGVRLFGESTKPNLTPHPISRASLPPR